MQRRAAAVYFVLFLVLGGGAYGFMQVGMSAPEVELDGPTYTEGDQLEVNGTTYTVTTVESETSGGEETFTGEVTRLNESNIETAALENGSTAQYQNASYTVQIENTTNVSSFTLVEAQNLTALVANDPDATGIVTDDAGDRFVRFRNESTVPVSEYLPTPDTATFSVGDEFFYAEENTSTTVDAVTPSEATLAWNSPTNETMDFGEGGNVTLAGQTYFGHFPDNSSVQILPADEYYGEYTSTLSDISYYQERQNGMWGIVLISLLAAIVLMSTAYLPSK